MTVLTVAGALVRACHPLPSAAVTVFGTALAVRAGTSAGVTALLAVALLTGQLTVGWLNDLVDADRDAAAGRAGKPVAAGHVPRRLVTTALVLAAGGCVVASMALGRVPGVLHLVAVGSAWAYDLRLKSTVASPVPYLVSFGLLPAIAATTAGVPVPPELVVAAGVLGAAAHFANTVPDAAADAATGVRGLPQRLGPRRSQVVAAGGVVLACAVLLVSGRESLSLPATVLLTGASLTGAVSPFAPAGWSFRLTLLAAAAAVAGVVLAG